jgi:hypothetical protein
MCLFIAKPRGIKRRVVWKLLLAGHGRYLTPHMYERVELGEDLVSDRTTTALSEGEAERGVVNRGIHVFSSKREARTAAKCWDNTRHIVVKALVDPADWVADGRLNEAVYMKIFLTDEIVVD